MTRRSSIINGYSARVHYEKKDPLNLARACQWLDFLQAVLELVTDQHWVDMRYHVHQLRNVILGHAIAVSTARRAWHEQAHCCVGVNGGLLEGFIGKGLRVHFKKLLASAAEARVRHFHVAQSLSSGRLTVVLARLSWIYVRDFVKKRGEMLKDHTSAVRLHGWRKVLA